MNFNYQAEKIMAIWKDCRQKIVQEFKGVLNA